MLFLVIVLYSLIASTFTLSKALISTFSPGLLLTIRFFVAGLVLCFIQRLFYQEMSKKSLAKEDYWLVTQASLGIYGAGFIFDNYAILFIDSSISSLLYNFSPFVTALLAFFFFKKRIVAGQLVGIVVSFLSIVMLFYADFKKLFYKDFFQHSIAYSVLMIAIIATSYGWLQFEKLINKGYAPLLLTRWCLWGGLIITIPVFMLEFLCSKDWVFNFVNPITVTGSLFLDLGLLIIISHVICGLLYGYLLRIYSATFVSLAGSITPLLVAGLGIIFLHENITGTFLYALLGTSIGVGIFYFYEEKNQETVVDNNTVS